MPTLNWLGKDKVVTYDSQVPFHVLNKIYNFGGKSDNKIIHGDNLLALKSLLPLYESKIKCIYIDPPYNTGNENWVYNDNVNSPQIQKWLGQVVGKEGEDYTRHDKWLCMMYPRLKLLKRLLADDGAIFISIDDNEVANLKFICDEIFGEQNFIAIIAVINNFKGRSDAKYIATAHESLVIYRKQNFITNGVPIPDEYAKEYKLADENGKYRLLGLRKRGANSRREDRPNMFYPFYYDEKNKHLSVDEIPNAIKILPYLSDGSEGCWRWGIDTAREKIFALTVKKVKGRDEYDIFQKDYLPIDGTKRIKPKSFWSGAEFSAESGTLEIKSILGKGAFDTPKPLGIIEYILQQATDKNSLVLDSFAGSGTTAHAVLNLNKADGGNRKFILIEMEDYAENITAERVRRVGGSFDYYEVGAEVFIDDELNPELEVEKVREYIWQVDTHTEYIKPDVEDCEEFIGVHKGTAYYFTESLDYEFLATLRTRANEYVIYAETCAVDKEFLYKHKIEFRKIPRDIIKYGGEEDWY